MKKLILFFCFVATFIIPAFSQSQNGIFIDKYYISGSLSVGTQSRNLYADNSSWLQLGNDTTKKGIIFPRVILDSISTSKKALFVYSIADSVLFHFDGTKKVRYMTYKDTALIKTLIAQYAPAYSNGYGILLNDFQFKVDTTVIVSKDYLSNSFTIYAKKYYVDSLGNEYFNLAGTKLAKADSGSSGPGKYITPTMLAAAIGAINIDTTRPGGKYASKYYADSLFNTKVGGSGTTNYLTRFTASNTVGNLSGTLYYGAMNTNGTLKFFKISNGNGLFALDNDAGNSGRLQLYYSNNTVTTRISGGDETSYINNGQNFLVGQSTDEGYKFLVNGTAYIKGNMRYGGSFTYLGSNNGYLSYNGTGVVGLYAFNGFTLSDGNGTCLVTGPAPNYYGVSLPQPTRIGSASSVANNAILQLSSTTRGLLLDPITTAQRNAISSPTAGLHIYCSDCTATDASTGVLQVYNGSAWKNCW